MALRWRGKMVGMTSLLEPFRGYVPAADFAPRIVGPPVSLLSPDQQHAARMDPLSFRHVVGKGAGAPHTEAREWLRMCREQGALEPIGPAVIIHRLARGAFSATGLIADVSVSAYDTGLIKRHETTIAKTERRMAEYMATTRIYGNPVALAHRDHPEVEETLRVQSEREPDITFTAMDGFRHSMWIVEGAPARDMCASFDDVLYITDGHHRLAAASTVAAEERRSDPHLPAGLFGSDQLQLRAFARGVRNTGVDPSDVIAFLRTTHELVEVPDAIPRPLRRHEVGCRVGRRSFVMTFNPDTISSELYRSLDVNLLHNLVLEPLFGITNPRTDARLRFEADNERRSHEPDIYDAWFLPYATGIDQVMAVADMGRAMPPKSTYFAPKLPSGIVIRLLER